MVNNRVKKKKFLTNNRPALRLYINNVRQKERRTGVPYISTLRFWKIPMTKRYSDTTIPRHRRGEIHYAILLSFRNFPDFRIQDEHTLLEFTMSAKNANHAFRNFGKTESRRKCTDFFFYRQTFVCLFAVFSTKLYTCQYETLHMSNQNTALGVSTLNRCGRTLPLQWHCSATAVGELYH